jgi:hypothetical protein
MRKIVPCVLFVLFVLLMSPLLIGCQAAQDMVLTGGDAIKAATLEVRKGVALYDTSLKADQAKIRSQLIAAAIIEFRKGAPATTQPGEDTPEMKAASLARVFDDALLQEQRRGELYRGVTDNLDFIDKVCVEMQKATVYSASIDAQVKDWIRSQLNVKQAVTTFLGTPAAK